ncbi:hypothetical protein Pelo_17661 [Pelomyxa schiedti]|nr:hypothetical protein Pelo_17661 [Pelomyxa schiedti]
MVALWKLSVCCQTMPILLSAPPNRIFSTIYPTIQEVLKAVDSMRPLSHFALPVLLALENYPRFESHRAVLDTMLSLTATSDIYRQGNPFSSSEVDTGCARYPCANVLADSKSIHSQWM